MSIDYEYIPPGSESEEDEDEEGFRNELPPLDIEEFHHRRFPSSYPPGTPAGLRGEAVRSALRSGRCITWQPHNIGGALRIHGKGTIDFLNNKLTKPAPETTFGKQFAGVVAIGSFYEACLLTSSGRTIDKLRVAVISEDTAVVLTSPGHSSQALLERLDPFIFPMDQVSLSLLDESSTTILTLASTQWTHVLKAMRSQVVPKVVDLLSEDEEMQEPFLACPDSSNESFQWCDLMMNDGTKSNVLILPSTGLPKVACVGYTLVFYPSTGSTVPSMSLGTRIWDHLISEANEEGPVHVGATEYETLRIEAGEPAYDCEIGGEDIDKRKMASLLEISQNWFDETVRPDRGCYLGQESVAAMRNNKRGAPRALYRIKFEDDDNLYESETRGGYQSRGNYVENVTRPPKAGDKLCVLGSNEEIEIGTITSIAEPGGTGRNAVYGLALIKRADSILRKMDIRGIDRPRWGDAEDSFDKMDEIRPDGSNKVDGSGMIMPPPLDPLENLEVVIKGTFTIGKLKMLPSRGLRRGSNMFDENLVIMDQQRDALIGPDGRRQKTRLDDEPTTPPVASAQPTDTVQDKKEEREDTMADEKAAAAAAESEAERKAAKMKLLEERAAEALARRKAKAAEQKAEAKAEVNEEDALDAAAAEARRKEEKMKMLKQRAEEAMAKRRQKQQESK